MPQEEYLGVAIQKLLAKPRYSWTSKDAQLARRLLGLTQAELAREIDYTPAEVSSIERTKQQTLSRVYELVLRHFLCEAAEQKIVTVYEFELYSPITKKIHKSKVKMTESAIRRDGGRIIPTSALMVSRYLIDDEGRYLPSCGLAISGSTITSE